MNSDVVHMNEAMLFSISVYTENLVTFLVYHKKSSTGTERSVRISHVVEGRGYVLQLQTLSLAFFGALRANIQILSSLY